MTLVTTYSMEKFLNINCNNVYDKLKFTDQDLDIDEDKQKNIDKITECLRSIYNISSAELT